MYENLAVANINTEVNGIELSFPGGRPPYEVLRALKEAGFRWHNKKQIWYARNTADHVRAVEPYVDLDASAVSFGVTSTGTIDVRDLRNQRLAGGAEQSETGSGKRYAAIATMKDDEHEWDVVISRDYQSPDEARAAADQYKQRYGDMVVSIKIEDSDDVREPSVGKAHKTPKKAGAVKAPCMADFYDRVGFAEICRNSEVPGAMWSMVGNSGYYEDLNAYISCKFNSAIVIELDNAMKRGQTCTRYTINSLDEDIRLYLSNECHIQTPKDLYEFVRSGQELPEGGRLYKSETKGVEVFSPFVAVKPLPALPEKWRKADLVRAIMAGQVFAGTLDQRLTDDYAYDAAYNFGAGRKVNLASQAEELVGGCDSCYICTEGVDENGIASVHFSYCNEMKTFKFDVNCDLAQSIQRQEQAKNELEAHNLAMKNLVRTIAESDIDATAVYVVDKIVEDCNTGKLGVKAEIVQGFVLIDQLDYEQITDLHEAEFVPDKLYQVASFFNRRDNAAEDARIIDTGGWGQVCSGKAFLELTQEGVTLGLTTADYNNPMSFEAAKRDCVNFITGKCEFLFAPPVDYTVSLQKLEAEEARVATLLGKDRGAAALDNVIGIAEVRKAAGEMSRNEIEQADREVR